MNNIEEIKNLSTYQYSAYESIPIDGIIGTLDFTLDKKIIEIKFSNEISLLHQLQSILYDIGYNGRLYGEFEIWNLYTGERIIYNYRIEDPFEFFNTICDISKLQMKKIDLLYDLETTGLDVNSCEIIQVHMEEPILNSIIYSNFIKPENLIPKSITEINGITNEMVKNCDNIKITIEKIRNKLRNVSKLSINAYNGTRFDHKIIDRIKLSIIKM